MSAFKIKTITAFVSIAPDGDEGVIGYIHEDTFMPLVCADEARIKSCYEMAQRVSLASGIPFRVLQFSERTDITPEIYEKYS